MCVCLFISYVCVCTFPLTQYNKRNIYTNVYLLYNFKSTYRTWVELGLPYNSTNTLSYFRQQNLLLNPCIPILAAWHGTLAHVCRSPYPYTLTKIKLFTLYRIDRYIVVVVVSQAKCMRHSICVCVCVCVTRHPYILHTHSSYKVWGVLA